MKTRIMLCVLLGIATLFTGCANDVGDIDRTQPNKLKKDVFEGEWYMRQTVVGVPGTGQIVFVGYEGSMERVRWRFQEDLLVAHRVHEDVLGIDTSAPPLPFDTDPAFTQVEVDEEWEGAPVAAFPIRGHLDVQRSYNSSTGEQSNVIMENMSDREWYDRDYVRVSWHNRIFSPGNEIFVALDMYSDSGWYEDGDDAATPLYVECKDAEGNFYECDADDLNNDEEIAYLETTNTFVLYPSWISCILTFGFPLYGGDCGPERIQVRTSIVKIDEEAANDYEPRLYDDNEMEWFGFFRTERCTYDRLYGCKDAGTIRLANRHNIWQEWFTDTDGDNEYTPGTDTRLSYAEREARPIVYYVNEGYPSDILDESAEIANQYNDAFVNIVKNVKDPGFSDRMFYLCLNSGSEEEIARIEQAITDGILENDADGNGIGIVEELTAGYTAGHCTAQGSAKRLGDVRYNYFAWVDMPQQVGPLGYGPSSTDPITGETVGANAYIYGASIDTYAQYTVDLIDLINGDIDPIEYGYGETVDGYLGDLYDSFGITTTGFSSLPEGSDSFDARTERMTQQSMEKFDRLDGKIASALERRQGHFGERLSMIAGDPSIFIRHQDMADTIWQRMKGTDIETRMITPEIKTGLGAGVIDPNAPVTDDVLSALSPRLIGRPPANGMLQTDLRDPRRNVIDADQQQYWERFNTFASRNMYMAEFLDDSLVGLAIDMREKYGNIADDTERRLRVWYDIRGLIYKHVMEHEVGHTVGLRHNFEATYDAMSFDPEYWRIRLENDATLLAENRECPGVPALMLGDHHCPSRGITRLDDEQRISEYAYSSTMDYGSKPNATSKGIGLYDHAALAYGYGELVHVFTAGAEPKKFEMIIDNNYNLANVADPMRASADVVTDWGDIDNVHEEGGGDLVNADLDYWHYSVLPVMFEVTNGDISNMYNREFVSLADYGELDAPSRLRVPYRFCSDEYRGGTPNCNVWDNGADYNEILETYIRDYDAYYFHNSYRRGRAAWGLFLWPHMTRLYGRYFAQLAGMYQHWTIRASSWGALWQLSPYAGGLQQVGVEDGLRKLLAVLAEPHPGSYLYDDEQGMYMNESSEVSFAEGQNGDWVTLEPGSRAKWRFSRYDYDSGYYYFLRYEILSSFWDRWAALWALTNPDTNFIGVDAASDITAYSIPFYFLYSYELSQWFGGIMTEDYETFSPVINKDLMTSGIDARNALEYRDPLASISKRAEYNDPTKYTPVNPYPGSYGNSSFNDRYFATIYSLAFFQVLYDKSFNHAADIAVLPDATQRIEWEDTDGDLLLDIQEGDWDWDGDGIVAYLDPDEQPPAESLGGVPELVTYQDPLNNKVYGALNYTGARAPLYSPAVAILEKANVYKYCWRLADPSADATCDGIDVNEFDIQNIREDIETIMGANQVFQNVNNPYWILFL